jgi:hypothetical protein
VFRRVAVQELAVETAKIGEEIFKTTLPLPQDYDSHLEARISATQIRLTTWWDALPDICVIGVLLVRYHSVRMNLPRGPLRPTPVDAQNKIWQALTISAAYEVLTYGNLEHISLVDSFLIPIRTSIAVLCWCSIQGILKEDRDAP